LGPALNLSIYKQEVAPESFFHQLLHLALSKMELLQSHRAEMISIAVALVAIVGGSAYYYYLTRKPKGLAFTSQFVSHFWLSLHFQHVFCPDYWLVRVMLIIESLGLDLVFCMVHWKEI
jgi:hypothetical protein